MPVDDEETTVSRDAELERLRQENAELKLKVQDVPTQKDDSA